MKFDVLFELCENEDERKALQSLISHYEKQRVTKIIESLSIYELQDLIINVQAQLIKVLKSK